VKAKGIQFGRKPFIDRTKLNALYQQGIGTTEIARQMGIGRSTVYKLLKEPEEMVGVWQQEID
jgi:DNA invertase Pin-like site-specific DNA recombinase